MLVSVVPLVLLAWLNTRIHAVLTGSPQQCHTRRTANSALRRRELRLGRGSLAIVLLFSLCHAPRIIPTLCELLGPDPKATLNTPRTLLQTVRTSERIFCLWLLK